MQDLLLKYGLKTSQPGDDVRLVAEEQTVATLQRLDGQRNEIVLQFLGGELGSVDLSGADLSGVDLSGVDLSNATLAGVTLSDANLSGATLTGASLNYAILTDADLNGAHLSDAVFTSADLTGAHMDDATLTGARLNGAYLNTADLSAAILSGADLSGASLSGAELTGADLSGAGLSGAGLSGADLSDAELTGADLSGTGLSSADLSNAHLSNADLSNANLSNANLSNANLSNANLSNANLSHADLSGADLTHADLSGVKGSHLRNVTGAAKSTQPELDGAQQCTSTDILAARLAFTRLVCHYTPIRLTYWYTESTAEMPYKEINKLIDQFEQQNPGITVHATRQQFFSTQTGYISAVQKGEAPDVFRSDIGWVGLFASKGYLLNIDSYIHQSPDINLPDYEYLKAPLGSRLPDGSVLGPLAYDEYAGHLYGLPQVTDVLALLYNKEELHNAGIYSPPSTMADLQSDAEQVVQYYRGKHVHKYGFETSGTAYYALPFLYAFGGGMFDSSNNVLVGSQGSVNGLQFLVSLEKDPDQVMPPEIDVDKGITNMTTDFMNGTTAMIFDGPWDIKNILNNGSAFMHKNSNLGIASIPLGPDGQGGSPLGGQSYVISATTAHPAEAYRFIRFMSKESTQAQIAEMDDTLPTRWSANQDNKVSSNGFISQFLNVWQTEAVARPAIPQGAHLFDVFDPSIWAALDGVESPAAALQAVANSWSQLTGLKQVP